MENTEEEKILGVVIGNKLKIHMDRLCKKSRLSNFLINTEHVPLKSVTKSRYNCCL